jgi:hypothetical protein
MAARRNLLCDRLGVSRGTHTARSTAAGSADPGGIARGAPGGHVLSGEFRGVEGPRGFASYREAMEATRFWSEAPVHLGAVNSRDEVTGNAS